jgi:protein translocase SecG subunit
MDVLIAVLGVLFAITCVALIALVLAQPGRTDKVASMGNAPVEAPTAFTDTVGVSAGGRIPFNWTLGGIFVFFTIVLALTILGNAHDRAAGGIRIESEKTPPPVSTPGAAPAPAGS